MLDLALRNVRIVDGSGEPAFEGDLGIHDGRIAQLGEVSAARVDLDGQGHTVAPGFVDVHSHDDGGLLNYPDMYFKTSQGVTTVINGNCGFSSVACRPGDGTTKAVFLSPQWDDLDGYRETLALAPSALNAMQLIGHNTVREAVMGMENRPPTTAEMDRMRALVRAGMEQGACGFSGGLIYAPGKWAAAEELEILAGEVAPYGGIIAYHIRNEREHLLEAVKEITDVGAAAGVPVQISHHKAAMEPNWGNIEASLAQVDAAVASGQDITLDVYPYVAGSGPMAQYFRDNIDLDFAAALQLASCPGFRDYEGRKLVEIAETEDVEITELIRRIIAAPGGDETVVLSFVMSEHDVETNLRHPRVMIGSDGICQLEGQPHPRLFGTFPRVLGEYVRNRQVAPLEEMIRRMTSLPADRFGLAGRGLIAEGNHADLVLFDPDRISDAATYEDPKQTSIGVDTVLVAGQVVWDGSAATPARPGAVLRFRQ